MTDVNSKLSSAMLFEIEKLRRAEQHEQGGNQGRVLGAFIDAALTNTSRTRLDLAKQLRMDNELVDALLDGVLPNAEFDDQTLTEIAQAIDYEPNVLRLVLGRMITPTQVAENVR